MANLSIKQEAFVREYLLSGNASDAYRRAGYSAKDVDVAGPRLLGNVGIAAAIAEGRKKIVAKADADFDLRLDGILRKLAQIATVDRTRLTAHRRGACRYCHGIEHRYQWRTPREFSQAVELHMLKGEAYQANHPAPKMGGGYGYSRTAAPDPGCPECDGLGKGYTVFADTNTMTDAEKIVFEGVKETKDGIQYLMSDRLSALLAIGKHLGLSEKSKEQTADRFTQAIRELTNGQAGSMPIQEDDDDEVEP